MAIIVNVQRGQYCDQKYNMANIAPFSTSHIVDILYVNPYLKWFVYNDYVFITKKQLENKWDRLCCNR